MMKKDKTYKNDRRFFHGRMTSFTIILSLFLSIFLYMGCSSEFFEIMLEGGGGTGAIFPFPSPKECPAGAIVNNAINCPDGGLPSYEFYVKDRRADADDTKNSYSKITAERIAVSQHFVIYRDQLESSRMSSADAEDVLLFLEIKNAYSSLTDIYGGDLYPDIQKTGRVVLLVYDIKDDYSTIDPAFIGGFFAPRDLFSNDFTTSLWDHPENMEDPAYGNFSDIESVDNLKGYSNENQIVYLDIYPFFDGTAYLGDTAKSKQLFKESILHECSHLFTYNKRILNDRVQNHLTWIAEGIAEQAPNLLAGEIDSQEERMDQYSLALMQSLLAEGPSLLDMNSSGNRLVGYLQTNLFYNYLRHRTGSAASAADLIESFVIQADYSVSGVDLVVTSFWDQGTGTGYFKELFRDWVLTNWLSGTGSDIVKLNGNSDLGDGNYPSVKYDLSYQGVGIGKKGDTGLAFQDNSLPQCYEDIMCIKPGSYVNFNKYTPPVDEQYDSAMVQGLYFIVIEKSGNEATVSFYDMGNTPTVNLTAGVEYSFIVYNPDYTSLYCLSTGQMPWDKRNLASWVGANVAGWQTGTGANASMYDGHFYRTSGIAFSTDYGHVYVSDYMSNSVSKWNLDTGTFEGRMGSNVKDGECTINDGPEDDGWKTNLGKPVGNHCRRSFNNPKGLAVDNAGNIYIADSFNHRIVKRDSAGAFVAWLGHPTDDTWQVGVAGENLTVYNYATDMDMFYSPRSIVIVQTVANPENDYFLVSCNGTNRIVKRNLSTGAYEGFIGNGEDNWSTATVGGNSGNEIKYFNSPAGIAIDDTYIYVADSENHRISRWTIAGDQSGTECWLGSESKYGDGTGRDGWHIDATEASSNTPANPIPPEKKYFNYPGDVYADATYLYIADRANQRVVRWNKTTGVFDGWIGGGYTEWETADDGPFPESIGSGYTYPPIFMLEPIGVTILPKSASGARHDYLYLTTIYNQRLSRWNLNCVEDNINEDCYDD